jgi:hypothetical protein
VTNVDEPQKDLRQAGQPEIKPLEPPEPLVVPPEQLRQQYDEMLEEETNRTYYHFAERINVRSYGQVLGFMKMHMAVYRLAREMPGFVAGGIKGAWCVKRFYTYTAWESRMARERFLTSPEHSRMVEHVVKELGAAGSGYVEWEDNEPPEWDNAKGRLENPGRFYVGPSR